MSVSSGAQPSGSTRQLRSVITSSRQKERVGVADGTQDLPTACPRLLIPQESSSYAGHAQWNECGLSR